MQRIQHPESKITDKTSRNGKLCTSDSEETTKATRSSGEPIATTTYSGQIIAPEAAAGGRATCSRLAATSRTLSQPWHEGAAGLGVTGGATNHPGQLSQQGQGWRPPFVPLGCVTAVSGGTHSVPPLLSDAELFWRRNAFALLNAAGWVCSRVAFRGWKSDTGPGCEAQGKESERSFPHAGVSCPDTSTGTDHSVVALPPFFTASRPRDRQTGPCWRLAG